MRPIYTTVETCFFIKKLAKLKVKTADTQLDAAREIASRRFGYLSWKHVCVSYRHYSTVEGPAPRELLPRIPDDASDLRYKQDLSKFDMKIKVDPGEGGRALIEWALSDGVPVSDDLKHLLFASSEETYGEDFDDYTVID